MGSGKSTIIEQLRKKGDEYNEVVPTVGFRVETFKRNKLRFTAFDMSGQSKYRNLWEKHYEDADAIIFVIDSTDDFRMGVVKEELDELLENKHIQRNTHVPILFLANKMDSKNAMSAAECMKSLGMNKIRDRPWSIKTSNALTGEGIDAGLDWLSENVTTKKNIRNKK